MSLLVFLFIALLAFSMAYYAVFLLSLYRGIGRLLKNSQASPFHSDLPFVSAVVAARNEAEGITPCVHSLFRQDYPPDKYEVIVVNDGSEDETAARLNALSQQYKELRVLSLTSQGKAAAITTALEEARGDIILTTDADCLVGSGWMRAMASRLANGAVLVAGPVVENHSHKFWHHLSALEYFSLTVTAAGLIGMERPIISSGASLGFKKSAFRSAGGFSSSPVDDEILLQRVYVRQIGPVSFAVDPNAVVRTTPPHSLAAFFRQRLRWAAKRDRYEDKSLLLLLALLYLPFFLLFIGGIVAIFSPILLIPLIAAWLAKSALDALVIRKGAQALGVSFRWRDFLVAELLHVPYIAIAAPLGQLRPIRWKGRVL
jgi:cellulose synthase/poly-beta-1,6-N-acetylglucosamine synthase-like glycosyltransferase